MLANGQVLKAEERSAAQTICAPALDLIHQTLAVAPGQDYNSPLCLQLNTRKQGRTKAVAEQTMQ
jgi:hypothetical protein